MEWLRLYSSILNDSKIMLLPEVLRWRYVGLLCIASESKDRGVIPSDEEVLFKLRISEDEWVVTLQTFIDRGLVEKDGGVCRVHGWSKRQYESDDSAPRVQKHRYNKSNVTAQYRYNTVTVTPPDTDTETDTEADQIQTAPASPDGDTPASIIPTKRAIPLNRVHDCWLKAIELFGESLTIQDLTPEFERTLSGVLYDKTGGVVKWLAAARALARAPASVKYEKSVTWLLQDQFKALNRVVTWAAQDRGTSGNGNTNYVEAPEKWKKRYADSAPR